MDAGIYCSHRYLTRLLPPNLSMSITSTRLTGADFTKSWWAATRSRWSPSATFFQFMTVREILAHSIFGEDEESYLLFVDCTGSCQFAIFTVLPHCTPQQICQILLSQSVTVESVGRLTLCQNAKYCRSIINLRRRQGNSLSRYPGKWCEKGSEN